MRRHALTLLVVVLAACTTAAPSSSPERSSQPAGVARAPFTSDQASLLDFELDGELVADTAETGAVRALVEAQLLFTVGQLNGERSVGQMGELELSAIHASPVANAPAPRFAVSYHARLPVAWGTDPKPASYTLTLPANLSMPAQEAFASKYGASCVDPSLGGGDVGYMYLAYRPQAPGCTLDPNDVVTLSATVSASAQNTSGKYPEYHRVWADGALRVVALFSRQFAGDTPGDEGARAYDDFLLRAQEYVAGLQPDASKRTDVTGLSPTGATTGSLSVELPDGRTIAIDAALVHASMADEGPAFDTWYESVTPAADAVLYNGHAGLGGNVRALMGKGSFRKGQYLIWYANGCDTFAYVDRTMAERRAQLNPDDPTGTKYMDTVTNVMVGYFATLASTSMSFVRALGDVLDPASPPQTYEQIFAGIAREQIVVVSGEEDNHLEPVPGLPSGSAPETSGATEQAEAKAKTKAESEELDAPPTHAAGTGSNTPKSADGCSVALGSPRGSSVWLTALLVGVSFLVRRQQRSSTTKRRPLVPARACATVKPARSS